MLKLNISGYSTKKNGFKSYSLKKVDKQGGNHPVTYKRGAGGECLEISESATKLNYFHCIEKLKVVGVTALFLLHLYFPQDTCPPLVFLLFRSRAAAPPCVLRHSCPHPSALLLPQ